MKKLKVGIASTDWSRSIFDRTGAPVPGGSGWVRLQQLRPHVDFQTITGTLIHHRQKGFGIADHYGSIHHDFDVLVMQRLMFKDLVRTMNIELTKPNRPYIINDVDDWYWGLDPSNAAYDLTRPEKNPAENIDHYKEVLRLSDALTVSTPFLENKMKTWLKHKNVYLIENCVTVADFNVRRISTKRPVVGWVGSTSHRSRDLEELQGIFPPNWRYHHSGHVPGAQYFADAMDLPREKVRTSPMVPPQQYAKVSFCFDIGIAPLSDQPFNHAKSWIKLIEYASAGIPFVASASPEYVRLQEEYGIGRIASTKDEWLENVIALTDFKVRKDEAAEQRKLVKALDVSIMAKRWGSIVRNSV